MENIVLLLTVLLRSGVLMLFSGVLGSSVLLLFLSVVSLYCCFCCCSSCRALPKLLGSAVHVATELSALCTVTAPVLLEVSSNASLLLALLLVFLMLLFVTGIVNAILFVALCRCGRRRIGSSWHTCAFRHG